MNLNHELIKSHINDIDMILLGLNNSFEDAEDETAIKEVVIDIEDHLNQIRNYL